MAGFEPAHPFGHMIPITHTCRPTSQVLKVQRANGLKQGYGKFPFAFDHSATPAPARRWWDSNPRRHTPRTGRHISNRYSDENPVSFGPLILCKSRAGKGCAGKCPHRSADNVLCQLSYRFRRTERDSNPQPREWNR